MTPREGAVSHADVLVKERDASQRSPRHGCRRSTDTFSRLLLVPMAPQITRKSNVSVIPPCSRQRVVRQSLPPRLTPPPRAGGTLCEGEGIQPLLTANGKLVIPR